MDDSITRVLPRTETEGWLTPEEVSFLDYTLRDPKLYQYLYTRSPVRMRYPPKYQGGYKEYITSVYSEFQRAHQTMRRLMNKSPYSLTNGQRAYTIVHDDQVPLESLDIGARVTFGYRLLILRPKYDIGKHSSLVELVFTEPVKIIPVGEMYYIMDEDHVFEVTGFERRPLSEHPSHGVPYHIDLFRMVSTPDYRMPDGQSLSDVDMKRIHLTLDDDEKAKLVISASNWIQEGSPALKMVEDVHGKREVDSEEFEKFRKSLGTVSTRFSDETLTVLYRIAERKRNTVSKILFDVHTHVLKLSHVIAEFKSERPVDTRYTDLEARISELIGNISKQLDSYFTEDATVSSSNAVLYMAVSSKHVDKFGDNLGEMIMFDNYLVGYTSTDSIIDRIGNRPGHVIVSLQIPPRMPVLVIPEHTGLSKQHRAVVLPRKCVFQLEEIRSIQVITQPRTYRKNYVLRYNRTEVPSSREERANSPPLGFDLGKTHLVQVEPQLLTGIMRKP